VIHSKKYNTDNEKGDDDWGKGDKATEKLCDFRYLIGIYRKTENGKWRTKNGERKAEKMRVSEKVTKRLRKLVICWN
jgi:hypothetical protein